MEGPGRLEAAVIGHHDRMPRLVAVQVQVSRDGDHGPRAVLQDPADRVVIALLGLEVEPCLLAQQDQVVPLGLELDLLVRRSHLLEDLAGDPRLGAAKT